VLTPGEGDHELDRGLASNHALRWARRCATGDRGFFHAVLGDGDHCRQGAREPRDVEPSPLAASVTLHGQQRVEGNEAPLHGWRSLLPWSRSSKHVRAQEPGKASAGQGQYASGRDAGDHEPSASPQLNALSIIAYLNTHSGDRLHRLVYQSTRARPISFGSSAAVAP